jgi:tetratricopeptide (TPR) repeat protein
VVVLIIALPSLQGVLFPLRTSVAVLPFPTASADPESASLGPAVAALAADDLGRIDQLKSIAPVSGTAVRRAAGSLEELADELQVGFVLRGDVSEQENGLLIRVTLQNIEKGLPVLSRSYTVALAELNLFRALLVKDVLQAMELDLPVPPMGSLTANGQAIRAYLNGIAGLATADSARIRAAADDFRLALAADSQMAEAAAGLGEASLRLYRMGGETDRGLLRDAQEFSQMALRIRPDIPQAYQTLGGVLRYRQKLTDARQALEHALELQPNAADARRQLALLNLMEGEYGAALQEADRAVRLDPRNPFSHEVMGNVHHLATRYEAALEAYERALTLGSSDSLLTMRYRMSAWIATGRGESAVAYAKRLADRFPGDYRVLYWAGQSVQLSGRALESQKMLDSADAQSSAVLARDPSNLDARLFRALILSRKGDFADAVAELAAAEQLAPGSALVLYRRANVLWIQNKKPEALQVLASAVSREFILPEVLGADFVYLAKEPEYAETVTVLQQNP